MNRLSQKQAITILCRENRKNMTDSERIIWELVRNRKIDGKKFLRQHKIIYENVFYDCHFFIADFYCAEEKLIVEIDGKIHENQKEFDDWRTLELNQLGIRVLRIENEDVTNEIYVTNSIKEMFIKK
ncbi:MAG: endonuclease domain-containing protein [Bacteroidota bacterium]